MSPSPSSATSETTSEAKARQHVAAEKPATRVRCAPGTTRRPRNPPTTCACESAIGCSSAESSSIRRAKTWFPTVNPATEKKLADVAEAGAADVDAAVRGGREAYRQALVEAVRRPSAASTSTASPASCRRRRASSRSSSRWTAASRSRSRATSTCRSPRRISSTTPAGPTSSTRRSPTVGRDRSASAARSFRGTSRC